MPGPYEGLGIGFDFAAPHLADVLFSTQKGLFFWSPALLLAVAGLFAAQGFARRLVPATVLIFATNTWLVASWWDWQFGASYGHRAFVDGFGLLAPLIAGALAWAARRPAAARLAMLFVAATVALSVVQMLQYWAGIMPTANTTWAQYRDVFLRLR